MPAPADERALVHETAPPLASSLEQLRPGEIVVIDRRGRAVSPATVRAMRVASFSIWGAVAIVGGAFYVAAFGPVGGLVFVAAMAPAVLVMRRFGKTRDALRKAGQLLAQGRLDEAEALLDQVSRRSNAKLLQATVLQHRGAIQTARGDHAQALASSREAARLFGAGLWSRRFGSMRRFCEYGEVWSLCSLGRVAEARARLASLGPCPTADALRLLHWTDELYIDFCEGTTDLAEAELWARAQQALRMNIFGSLLAMCAWGYRERGDVAMSDHLLSEAFTRIEGEHLPRSAPTLWAWMERHRPA